MGLAHKIRLNSYTALVIGMCIFVETTYADEFRLKSSDEPATVVELYTSHGCSSCPPADTWLRKYINHKDLWIKVIPMAFHVDYWDYLGWKDRFANSKYSNRQREYRSSGKLRAVYTPGFVVGGNEWRGWFRGNAVNILSDKQVGRLEARVVPNKKVMARFTPNHDTVVQNLRAHVAVLGFGIQSNIGAGENSGRTLAEDFVVLGDSSTSTEGDLFKWELPWPVLKAANTDRRAVVVWLSDKDDPTPIQAVGGWLN